MDTLLFVGGVGGSKILGSLLPSTLNLQIDPCLSARAPVIEVAFYDVVKVERETSVI